MDKPSLISVLVYALLLISIVGVIITYIERRRLRLKAEEQGTCPSCGHNFMETVPPMCKRCFYVAPNSVFFQKRSKVKLTSEGVEAFKTIDPSSTLVIKENKIYSINEIDEIKGAAFFVSLEEFKSDNPSLSDPFFIARYFEHA